MYKVVKTHRIYIKEKEKIEIKNETVQNFAQRAFGPTRETRNSAKTQNTKKIKFKFKKSPRSRHLGNSKTNPLRLFSTNEDPTLHIIDPHLTKRTNHIPPSLPLYT